MAEHYPNSESVTITDLSSAQTFTTPSNCDGIYAQAQTKNVRIKFLGGTPTATSGFLLVADTDPWFIPLKPGTLVAVIEVEASATFEWQPVYRA